MRQQEDLQKAHRRRKNRESLLETLESIVVAFVLAFIFRAFIVEAFVIPTGSMAPTLYGAHKEFKCSDCGYEFAVGVGGSLTHDPLCPNCYLAQPRSDSRRTYSGDRILVLKYLYDFEEPRRWDVIVFHNPNDPSQNFIKRLVALPGETIEVVWGDITINGQIVRKPDYAQDALWMLVHDTRNRPTKTGWIPRWQADREWAAQGAGYVLDNPPDREKVAWLTYRHRGPRGQPPNIVPGNILDYYAYNSGSGGSNWDNPADRFGADVCTDLGLKTEVTAASAASVIVIDMRAYKDRFRFELTADGSDQPTRILLNGRVVAQSTGGVLPVGRSVRVEAANVDHKLMLLVGGRRVAQTTGPETTPEGDLIYTPMPLTDQERERFDNPPKDDPQSMAAEVRIGARSGPAKVAYLRLDRDVYYRNSNRQGAHGEGIGDGHGTQGHPFSLQQGEYFVCGDNSPQSYDSRLWALERPVVPQRNLVGKAFFVYWPAAGMRWGIPVAPDPTGWRLVH